MTPLVWGESYGGRTDFFVARNCCSGLVHAIAVQKNLFCAQTYLGKYIRLNLFPLLYEPKYICPYSMGRAVCQRPLIHIAGQYLHLFTFYNTSYLQCITPCYLQCQHCSVLVAPDAHCIFTLLREYCGHIESVSKRKTRENIQGSCLFTDLV